MSSALASFFQEPAARPRERADPALTSCRLLTLTFQASSLLDAASEEALAAVEQRAAAGCREVTGPATSLEDGQTFKPVKAGSALLGCEEEAVGRACAKDTTLGAAKAWSPTATPAITSLRHNVRGVETKFDHNSTTFPTPLACSSLIQTETSLD